MYFSITLLFGLAMSIVQRMGVHNRKWRQMPTISPNRITPNSRGDNKSLICISPGGFKGFYLSGVIAYIKDNYDISDLYFSGASAGSWNAVLFTYRGNLTDLIWNMIQNKPVVAKNETIRDYKYYLKQSILDNYTSADFDLDRVFIGVTTLRRVEDAFIYRPTVFYGMREPYEENSTPPPSTPVFSKTSVKETDLHKEEIHAAKMFVKTSIFSRFKTLEDALDCCIASSHIPFFMGRVFHIYDNQVAFDGGFSHYPYYPFVEPILNITPTMWNRSYAWPPGVLPKKRLSILEDYTTLLSKDRFDFWELFQYGYEDTKQNCAFLDKILRRKNA